MINPLMHVRKGMNILDRAGERIGSVDWVKLTAYDPEDSSVRQMTPDDTSARQDTLLDNLLEAFQVDEVPEPMRETLLRKGFIRMDSDGIFASDRYVLPDQVAGVQNDEVVLTVEKSDLIKPN